MWKTLPLSLLLFSLVSFLGSPLSAGPDRASVLLGSRHIGATGYEEFNPGVFLTWEWDRVQWNVGVYQNSYGKPSAAATVALPIIRWDDGELSAFLGGAYYPEDGRHQAIHLGDFIPMGGVQLRHRSLFMQVFPMDGKPVDAIISFGLTFELGGLSRRR